ncbi:MAG: phosphohistidine phosphatase SixA [Candidatus Njordarchaeia archaeon]
MKIYLVQHGKSKSKDEDPSRPLTDEGFKETERIANFAKKIMRLNTKVLIHSPKLRAKQTAEILGKHLGPFEEVIETDEISPLSDPNLIASKIEKMDKDTIIVGHLPHLSKLTSLLTVGDPEKEIVQFRYSCILCLEYKEGEWLIRFFITPDTIPTQF